MISIGIKYEIFDTLFKVDDEFSSKKSDLGEITQGYLIAQKLDGKNPNNCDFTLFNYRLLMYLEERLGGKSISKKVIKKVIAPHSNLVSFAQTLSEKHVKSLECYLKHDSEHYNIYVTSSLVYLSKV